MAEPIAEISKFTLYGNDRDVEIIVEKVRLPDEAYDEAYDKWRKEKEVNITATEVRMRQEEASKKVIMLARQYGKSRIGVEYFKEFVDQMRKKKEVDAVFGERE